MEALRKGHDIISLEIDWQMGAMHGHHLSSYTSRIFLNKLQDTRKALNLDLEMVGTLHTKIDKQVSEVVALYKEARQSFGLIQILGILKFFASEFKVAARPPLPLSPCSPLFQKYSKSKFTEPEAEYIRRIQQEC